MTPETPSLSPDPVEINPGVSLDEVSVFDAGTKSSQAPSVDRQRARSYEMSERFTPGPWEYRLPLLRAAHRGDIISACNGFPERHIARTTGQDTAEEREANAHLIAAAPQLYHALRNLLRVCETGFTGWPATFGEVEARNMAIAAILKATGDR